MRLIPLLMMLPMLLLSACSARIEDYRGMQPPLDLRRFFNGHLVAHGQFQDRSGKVVKRFTVDMTGSWQGNEGSLDEHFRYDDGSTQRRTWQLSALPDGYYRGRAADIDGEARGRVVGPALHWQYTLLLPVKGHDYHVHMNDWMYLQDENTLINRTEMSKFDLRLGEVTLFIRRVEETP